MFWARTSPVGEATTDFGEMRPVIRCRRTSVVVSEAGRRRARRAAVGAGVGVPARWRVRATPVAVGRTGPAARPVASPPCEAM